MEDVLCLNPESQKTGQVQSDAAKNLTVSSNKQQQSQKRKMTRASIISSIHSRQSQDEEEVPASGQSICPILKNYEKWHYFLITWKRCELLKLDWGRRKLGVENINTPELYAKYR